LGKGIAFRFNKIFYSTITVRLALVEFYIYRQDFVAFMVIIVRCFEITKFQNSAKLLVRKIDATE
jgi:hypothetical protein